MVSIYRQYIDGLVQERRNSSAFAMELRLSCINPSILFKIQRCVSISISQEFIPNILINIGFDNDLPPNWR